MLSVVKITGGVYFLKQNNSVHPLSTSNGYLIVPSQIQSNLTTNFLDSLLLDVNLEEKGWIELKKICIEQGIPLPSKLIMTHCHLDHSCHVHRFVEIFNGLVYAPEPEVSVILEHNGFFNVYQIHEMMEIPNLMDSYHHLKYEILQFGIIPKQKITTFVLGYKFDFGTIQIDTIPLTAHSIGHVGFFLTFPENGLKIFHNSCLGLDHPKLSTDGKPKDGFGPWYGFKQSDITDYLEDITKSEIIFQDCDILTSSHGIVFTHSKIPIQIIHGGRIHIKELSSEDDLESPFDYMRRKIQERENFIREAIMKLEIEEKDICRVSKSRELIRKLLDMDLIYSRSRIPPKQLAAYKFWEHYLIVNHLRRIN